MRRGVRLVAVGLVLACALAVVVRRCALVGVTGSDPTERSRVSVGVKAPDFALSSASGATVTLGEFRGKRNVVLAFYPGLFTQGG